jgi:hypothetical protein
VPLFKKYKKTVSFFVNQASEEFLETVLKQVKNAKRKEGSVLIHIRPSFLNPFEGQGIIVLHASSNGQHRATVACELIPISPEKSGSYFLLFLLLLWTLASFTIYYGPFSIPMVIIGWFIAFSGYHVLLTWTMNKLETKLNKMMKLLGLSHIETTYLQAK